MRTEQRGVLITPGLFQTDNFPLTKQGVVLAGAAEDDGTCNNTAPYKVRKTIFSRIILDCRTAAFLSPALASRNVAPALVNVLGESHKRVTSKKKGTPPGYGKLRGGLP
jgi:hypothetical protein